MREAVYVGKQWVCGKSLYLLLNFVVRCHLPLPEYTNAIVNFTVELLLDKTLKPGLNEALKLNCPKVLLSCQLICPLSKFKR